MTNRDIHAIRDLGARMADAEAAFDAAFFENALADDVVIMAPNIPAMVGKQACLEFIRRTLSEVQLRFDRRTFNYLSEEVVAFGNVAVDRGTYETSLLPKAGGEAEDERGQYLRMFSREPDGAWKVWRVIWNMIFPPEAQTEWTADES